MAYWLRALTILPKYQSSIPSIHKAIYNHLQLQFWGIQCPPLAYIGTACRQKKIKRKKKSPHTFLKMFFKRSILSLLAFKSETEGIFSSRNSSPSCSSELATHSISSCRWSAAAALNSAGISPYRTI